MTKFTEAQASSTRAPTSSPKQEKYEIQLPLQRILLLLNYYKTLLLLLVVWLLLSL